MGSNRQCRSNSSRSTVSQLPHIIYIKGGFWPLQKNNHVTISQFEFPLIDVRLDCVKWQLLEVSPGLVSTLRYICSLFHFLSPLLGSAGGIKDLCVWTFSCPHLTSLVSWLFVSLRKNYLLIYFLTHLYLLLWTAFSLEHEEFPADKNSIEFHHLIQLQLCK